jgi:hypothetical protein
MDEQKNEENGNVQCHDCKKEIEVSGDKIIGGVLLAYDCKPEKVTVFKCNECFSKNPSLANYQQCEVYSRIVGYIRPVQQWNPSKQEEYSERKKYKIPEKA